MKKEAILHIPMSQYAHGISESEYVIRIRTAKDDISECNLFYGDTACRKTPIDFFRVPMKKIAHDLYFDYYEAEFECPYTRLYYYFELSDGAEKINYFSNFFREDLPDDRSEYYKLPFNHRADIAKAPDWVKDAVIYNIFPDSFATSKGYISCSKVTQEYKNEKMKKPVSVSSRLGGTIRGIAENVTYLTELGINCIYINPIFAAGEYHKYDTLDYFSVDPCFGTNEDFRDMVKTLHENGVRVIIDGVFNHIGWQSYPFEDVVANGEKSHYKEWFYGLKFPVERPSSCEEYPTYDCFAYERMMPKLDTTNREVEELILRVAEYWIKEFDIDGWRLDVASEVNDEFWRKFRRTVKAAKEDAFIIGEVWESAGHWMQGDMYDSTMNYDLRKFCKYYFADGTIDTETFDAGVTDMMLRYKKGFLHTSLNLLDSHDVPRFLSTCGNDRRRYKLAVLFQMMFLGAPSIFYGDEQGIEGLTELEWRSPMRFDCEDGLYSFFKTLIGIRNKSNAIRRGSYERIMASTSREVYAFERSCKEETVRIILNNSEESQEISCDIMKKGSILYSEKYEKENILGPYGFAIIKV